MKKKLIFISALFLISAVVGKINETIKTSSSRTSFLQSGLGCFSQLSVIEIVRSVTLFSLFLIVCSGSCNGLGFKQATQAGFFLFGVIYFFFPAGFIEYMIDGAETDPVLDLLQQSVGLMLLSNVIIEWHCKHESTQYKGAACIVRFITFLGVFLIHMSAHLSGKIAFSMQHMSFLMLFVLLMIVSHMMHIYVEGDFGKRTPEFRLNIGLNRHLMLDIVMLALGTIIDMADTEDSFQYMNPHFQGVKEWRPNLLHIHMGKVNAMGEMGMLLMSMMALGFSDDRDKRRVFLQRLLVTGVSTPLVALYQYKYMLFTDSGFAMVMMFNTLWMVNSGWPVLGSPKEVLCRLMGSVAHLVAPMISRYFTRFHKEEAVIIEDDDDQTTANQSEANLSVSHAGLGPLGDRLTPVREESKDNMSMTGRELTPKEILMAKIAANEARDRTHRRRKVDA